MQNYSLAEESLGYVTSDDPSNTDYRFLVAGSKNVQINSQKKFYSRSGYTRLGVANPALYNVRNGWDWQTSTGVRRSCRFYNDTLEVYLENVDGTDVDAWTAVHAGFSTTKILRSCIRLGGNGGWYDNTEKMDLCLMVNGDNSIYEWNGAVAIVAAVSSAIGIIGTLATAPTAGGTNTYAVGDILTITDGDGTATARVTATNGAGLLGAGAVTAVEIVSRGTGYSTGTGKATTGGGGTGATLNITAIGTGSITKTGTTTWAQNRFYTTRNQDFHDVRTGTNYSASSGYDTTTIVDAGDTSGIQVGDIIMQNVITTTSEPTTAPYTNDIIFNFQNQIIIESAISKDAYGSKNTDFADFSFSSPRLPGEGFVVTMDDVGNGISFLGKNLLLGAGKSTIFQVVFTQLAVGATITETADINRLYTGVNQGFLGQESIIPIGNTIFYLSNEVALRSIDNPNNLTGLNPKTLSYPIKPDFDAEDWSGTPFGTWYKNIIFVNAPATSHTYMLNFVEDANGKLFRFWNPPQVLPGGPYALISIDGQEQLYGHSNAVPETYLLFDGGSDGQYDGMPVSAKLPIEARAVRAYNNYKRKGSLKNFDEFFSEGDITANTIDLSVYLRYDYGGMTQTIMETINGSDEDILEGNIGVNSLAQTSLATNPLGGLLYPPDDARRYRVIFEEAKEDFFELQTEYYTNDVDQYWGILADGINVQLSPRRSTNIKF